MYRVLLLGVSLPGSQETSHMELLLQETLTPEAGVFEVHTSCPGQISAPGPKLSPEDQTLLSCCGESQGWERLGAALRQAVSWTVS